MKKNCKYCGRTIYGNDDFCCDPCRDKYNERYAPPPPFDWLKLIEFLFYFLPIWFLAFSIIYGISGKGAIGVIFGITGGGVVAGNITLAILRKIHGD